MMVWSVAVVLILVFGGMGAFAGFAPAACGLVMMLLAMLLGKPLTSLVAMVLPKDFVGHPLAAWFPESMYTMELLLVMVVFFIVFWGVGFWVQTKIDYWLKVVGSEVQRMTWKYLTHGVGLFLGLCTAVIFMLVIAGGAYAPGYLSTQTTPSDANQPKMIPYLNSFRKDMQATGLDKIAARFDRTPAKYFEVCDTIGLIENNPAVMYRVEHYPLIYAMMDRSEVSGLVNDETLKNILKGKDGGWAIFNNATVLSFMNSGSYSELKQDLDLKDFTTYLNTGKSEKYDNFHLLGDWELDVDRVVLMAKKNKPDISYREMKLLAMLLQTYFDTASMRVTIDKKVIFKDIIGGVMELNATLSDPSNPRIIPQIAAPPQAQNQVQQPAAGGGGGGRVVAPGIIAPSRVRAALNHNARTQEEMNANPGDQSAAYNEDGTPKAPEAPKIEKKSVNGTWTGDGDLYKIQFGGIQMDVIIENDILTMSAGNARLYFIRRY